MILLLLSFLSYLLCFLIREYFDISAVLSSAVVGIVGSFIARNKFMEYKDARMIIYSGCFAALVGNERIWSIGLYLIIPLGVFSVFKLLQTRFNGYGGKLGTIAFLSVSSYILIAYVL